MDEPPAKAARRDGGPDSPGGGAAAAPARAPWGPAALSLLDLPEEVLVDILDRVVVRTVGGAPLGRLGGAGGGPRHTVRPASSRRPNPRLPPTARRLPFSSAPQHFRLASDVYRDSLNLALSSVQGLLVVGRAWARHGLVEGPQTALEPPRRHPAAAAYQLRWAQYRAALREWQQQHGPEEAPAQKQLQEQPQPQPQQIEQQQQQPQQQQQQQQAAVPACLPAPAPLMLGVEPEHLRSASEQQLREWCGQLGLVVTRKVGTVRGKVRAAMMEAQDYESEDSLDDDDDDEVPGGAVEAAAAAPPGPAPRWLVDERRDEWQGAEEAAKQEGEQGEQRWEEQEQEQDLAAAAEAGQQEREAAAWTVAAGPFAQPLPPPLPPSWVRFRRDAAAQIAACMAAGGRGRRGPD
jgi:hypothetical protein